jgi:hypothetical protein
MIKEELYEEEIAKILGAHPRQTGISAGPPPMTERTGLGTAPAGISPNGQEP